MSAKPVSKSKYIKLLSKVPEPSKFKFQILPDRIMEVGLDQPHYTIKGRNTCKKFIHRKILDIVALIKYGKPQHKCFMEPIRNNLDEITFMIYIMNGNRLKAEKTQDKIKSYQIELLNTAMFPDDNTKWGGGFSLNEFGNIENIEAPRDTIPEQRIIDLGKEATETNQSLEWCLENIDIISKVW